MPATTDLRVLSLGGGVQSSALALMLNAGALDCEPPDVAIWADTGNDPPEVFDMVAFLASECSFEVVVVRAKVDILHGFANGTDASGHPTGSPVPTFTRNPDGTRGQSRRFCTEQWKLRPIRREIRRRLGLEPGQRFPKGVTVQVMLGISYDELGRMQTDRSGWEVAVYPLIDAKMTRQDCETWWRDNAPPIAPALARSACVICPFRSRREWRDVQRRHPEMVQAAAEAEASYQASQHERGYGHIRHYLHPRRIPLMDALAADAAQGTLFDEDTDCTGVCWT